MSKTVTDEKTYIAESLEFINSYKKYFSPVLSKIAKDLNNDKNKDLITSMKNPGTNSKELIDMLIPFNSSNKVKTYNNKDGTLNHPKYVEESLAYLYSTDAKERIHGLLIAFIDDMKKDQNLMKQVDGFKKDNEDWKKMVGMLIPEGAIVKLLYNHFERNTSDWDPRIWNDIFRKNTGQDLICTVSKRGLLERDIRTNKHFKKQIILPKDILFKLKRGANSEVPPEAIELFSPKTGEEAEPEAKPEAKPEAEPAGAGEEAKTEASGAVTSVLEGEEKAEALVPVATREPEALVPVATTDQLPQADQDLTGTATGSPRSPTATGSQGSPTTTREPEAEPAEEAVGPEQVNLELQKGGSQRLTRKHKNSIGTSRKNRTNR